MNGNIYFYFFSVNLSEHKNLSESIMRKGLQVLTLRSQSATVWTLVVAKRLLYREKDSDTENVRLFNLAKLPTYRYTHDCLQSVLNNQSAVIIAVARPLMEREPAERPSAGSDPTKLVKEPLQASSSADSLLPNIPRCPGIQTIVNVTVRMIQSSFYYRPSQERTGQIDYQTR